MNKRWQGIFVATVTPFRGGEVDVEGYIRHVDRLLEAGIHGLCPAGTTGEGSSLSDREFALVLETVLGRVQGKIPVVAGTGSNDTERTIERTKLAKTIGADGALVVTPYYVKPTQAGLIRHYQELAHAVDFPVMMYNVPGRTAVNMLPETVHHLAQTKNISGIKECAAVDQVAELLRLVGKDLSVFSGEDGVMYPFLSMGGDGVVSVLANVIPQTCVDIYEAVKRGEGGRAREQFESTLSLTRWLFSQPNPLPVKAALGAMGIMQNEVRSPLVEMRGQGVEEGLSELKKRGVLS